MRHIDSGTTPGEVMRSGHEWILRGNGHVYPWIRTPDFNRLVLRSYDTNIAWYEPFKGELIIGYGAFSYSPTTSRHVRDFTRWLAKYGAAYVLVQDHNPSFERLCSELGLDLTREVLRGHIPGTSLI